MAVSYTIGGNPYISTNSTNPYQDIYNQYAQAQEKVKEADQSAWQTRKDADTKSVNDNYDSSSKQNYVNYMQQQKALPSQLQNLGVNGGASESAQLRLNTAYGNNIASNESARNSALNSVNTNYETEWNDYLNDYNQNLADVLKTAQENDIAYQRELAERDLEQFSASITGRYKTKAEYQALINQLQKSSDVNKAYKIALAQQAMNALDDSSSSGSSSSYYSSGSSSSSNSSGNSSADNTDAKKTAKKTTKKTTSALSKVASALKKSGTYGQYSTRDW